TNRNRVHDGTLKERVGELVKIRDEGGYMAELGHAGRNVVEMMEHNCPIMAVAEAYPEACGVEREMFQKLLAADVETSHRVVAGDAVCRFLIRGRTKVPAGWAGPRCRHRLRLADWGPHRQPENLAR